MTRCASHSAWSCASFSSRWAWCSASSVTVTTAGSAYRRDKRTTQRDARRSTWCRPSGAVPPDNHRSASDRLGDDPYPHPGDLVNFILGLRALPCPPAVARGAATPPTDQGRRPRHDLEVGGDRGRSAGRPSTARDPSVPLLRPTSAAQRATMRSWACRLACRSSNLRYFPYKHRHLWGGRGRTLAVPHARSSGPIVRNVVNLDGCRTWLRTLIGIEYPNHLCLPPG